MIYQHKGYGQQNQTLFQHMPQQGHDELNFGSCCSKMLGCQKHKLFLESMRQIHGKEFTRAMKVIIPHNGAAQGSHLQLRAS